ncbi:uncharacterized protein LOC108454890 [Gossypium arboreum]|uniref:uncharacterized protein LOC108454890 n=1 Tax=Gossypium arboreum TaxID=29729 RepID=UPI0022F1BEE4|nr:uncharacterized protein LOC108454890 [Gossypium arboreum]
MQKNSYAKYTDNSKSSSLLRSSSLQIFFFFVLSTSFLRFLLLQFTERNIPFTLPLRRSKRNPRHLNGRTEERGEARVKEAVRGNRLLDPEPWHCSGMLLKLLVLLAAEIPFGFGLFGLGILGYSSLGLCNWVRSILKGLGLSYFGPNICNRTLNF